MGHIFDRHPYGKLTGSIRPYVRMARHFPAVSVGSGTGALEASIADWCGELICVDPSPNSYDKGAVVVRPQYMYAGDVATSRPDLVGNCSLVLAWPSPHDGDYDMAAIETLRPRVVVVIYDSTGSGGGHRLHEFLAHLGLPSNHYARYASDTGGYTGRALYNTSSESEDAIYSITIAAIVRDASLREELMSLPSGEINA